MFLSFFWTVAATTDSTRFLCSTDYPISQPSAGWTVLALRWYPPEEWSMAKRNDILEVTALPGYLTAVNWIYSVNRSILASSKGSVWRSVLPQRVGTASTHPSRRSTNSTRMSSMLSDPTYLQGTRHKIGNLESPGHETQTGRGAWKEGGKILDRKRETENRGRKERGCARTEWMRTEQQPLGFGYMGVLGNSGKINYNKLVKTNKQNRCWNGLKGIMTQTIGFIFKGRQTVKNNEVKERFRCRYWYYFYSKESENIFACTWDKTWKSASPQ